MSHLVSMSSWNIARKIASATIKIWLVSVFVVPVLASVLEPQFRLTTQAGQWFVLPLFPMVFLQAFLFSEPGIYIILLFITLAVLALAFWKAKRLVHRLVTLLFLGIVAIHPFVTTYNPSVLPVIGADMKVVTPQRFLDNVTKNAKAMIGARPCNYRLLGWLGEAIYFQENCSGARSTWTADLQGQTHAIAFEQIPTSLQAGVCPNLSARKLIASSIDRTSPLASWLADLIIEKGEMPSLNCRHVAVVVNDIEGPSDVIVLSTSSP